MSVDTKLFIEAMNCLSKQLNHTQRYMIKKVKEYADKNLKKKLWCELCMQFVEKWDELSDKEKKVSNISIYYILSFYLNIILHS